MRFHKIEKGRYVVYFGDDFGDAQIRLEFSRKYNFGLGFKIGREERELQFSAYCWRLFSVWVTFDNKHLKYSDDLCVASLVWQSHEHVIKAQFMDYSEMDSSKPSKLDIYFDYRDFLFGRSIHSESRHREHKGKIYLPEKVYDMTLDFYTSYWHRPRSPFVKKIERVEITPEIPVPIPGKGENSWDMDDDAVHSTTMPVKNRTVEELLLDFENSIKKSREEYGGFNWKPA